MSTVNGLGSSIVDKLTQYQPKNQKTNKTKDAEKANNFGRALEVQKNKAVSETHIQEGVELSDKAKKVLDELKEKYGNMDFFVSNYSSDEEAEEIMSRGTKQYSVLIEPEVLEQMAEDDTVKEKYMGIIDESTSQLDSIKEELEESGQEVQTIGVKIDADGAVKFFAKIKEQNEKYQKQIAEEKEAKKAEDAAKEAKEEEAKRMEKLRESIGTNPYSKKEGAYEKVTTVFADSAEELLEKIKNVDWSQIEATPVKGNGQKFDFSV
ncbi:DUF6033 family protein [Butyrivibrio sp. NC2002]|uniref:DUF6033 family protein n=1 Tax=Butyrivibrio sp. NC2002 TaxID=1410610 RepID=UPI00056A6BE1|nr:DUF6033 family protein [Butyrivibrio sp. NC2002]